MKKLYIIGLIIGLIVLAAATIWAEQFTLTTYYPAPYGVYKELKTTGETLLATDSGNVGIGTTSPNIKLDVEVINDEYFARFFRTTGDGGLSLGVDTGTSIAKIQGQLDYSVSDLLINPEGGNVGIGTTDPGTARLAVMGGNVGIGTTTPGAELEVAGDIYLSNGANREIKVDNAVSGTGYNLKVAAGYGGSAGGALSLAGGFGMGTGGNVYIYGGAAEGVYGNTILAHTGSMSCGRVGIRDTSPDGVFEINPNSTEDSGDEFVVDAAGNVGIGTTSPGQLLHVNKNQDTITRIRLENPSTGSHAQALFHAKCGTVDLHVGATSPYFQHAYGPGWVEGSGWIGTYGAHALVFLTGNMERVRITGSGNVGIGMVSADGRTKTDPTYQLQLSTDSAAKPGGGTWADTCDIRLKKNITPITDALDKITKLQGVNFEWKNPDEHKTPGIHQGFIAQDVEKVFPNFISDIEASGKDKKLTRNGKIKSLSLPFDFDAYLVEAIKELKAENDALKARIEVLEKSCRKKYSKR